MAPFLYSEVYCVLQVLMRWFIKRDVMDKATTPKKLNEIDINSPENVCDPKYVDIGTQAKSYLRKGSITRKEKQNFRKECLEFLIATVSETHERSPTMFSWLIMVTHRYFMVMILYSILMVKNVTIVQRKHS